MVKSHPVGRGFTLVELLVVIAIIAILSVIILPALAGARQSALLAREVNAGRQIMGAYAAYSAEHDGRLLSGYDKTVESISVTPNIDVTGIMCARYPWRLAPYIGGQMDDVFLINATRKKTAAMPVDSFNYQYLASLHPAFGINAYCIGGYEDGSGSGYYSTDVVRTIASSGHASSLIVFVSARFKEAGGQSTPGFHLVTPPKFWRTKWTVPFDASKTASSFGNVDLRWDGQAVCSFLDGHTALLKEKELLDMRHWSNTAAETNDPNFSVPR